MAGKNRLWDFDEKIQFLKRGIVGLFGTGIIEQVVRRMKPPSFLASLTPDGCYEYDGQVYRTEGVFNEVVDKLFTGTERQKVIVLD